MSGDVLTMDVLEKLPIFDGMTEDERQQLVDISSTLMFKPGEVAIHQGKSGQDLLVVLEGECDVVRSDEGDSPREFVLAKMKPYDHFGEMSFFDNAPHSATVRAKTELKLLRIERRDYDLLRADNSIAAYKLAYNILDEFADRLRRMDRWVMELLGSEPEERATSEWSTFREKLFTRWDMK